MTIGKRFEKKVALVTGGGGGIGRAICIRLGSEGAHVYVNLRKSKEPADDVVKQIEKAGGSATAIQGDVVKVKDIERMIEAIKKDTDRIDILVNNAGFAERAMTEHIEEDSVDRVLAINIKSPLFVTKHALPMMKEGSAIIHVSSSLTENALPGASVYTAAKMGERGLTFVQAQELGPKGITVNSVLPGPTAPGAFDKESEQMRKEAAASSPFNRLGTPDDIAGVVAFLASKDARWVTGQHILVNGGAKL